jgi:MoaA/NifB/PqqE/SkfB family radical SAM enzyme
MGPDGTEFPKSIDINPTSKCQLECEFCWGPDHNIPAPLNTIDWMNIIDFFAGRGTKGIVFTGGEPLMRPDIGKLLEFSKRRGLRVTLSTNTLLLPDMGNRVLPYVDEIGIPMDGASSETNNNMRKNTLGINSFWYQMRALEGVKANYPDIHVTIRTVMSKMNIYDMSEIGRLLTSYREGFDRWKIYQFAPYSYGRTNSPFYWISDALFKRTVTGLLTEFPDHNIAYQPASSGEGRYIFVGSTGDVYGVGSNYEYKIIGNFKKGNFLEAGREVTRQIPYAFDEGRNSVHAV